MELLTNKTMKTEVIVKREMNGVEIRQNSKTGFFNANDLLDLYNLKSGEAKRMQNYLDNKDTKLLMEAILTDFQNNSNWSEFELGVIKTKRGKDGGTWMHPYLMMDFGMWLSPEFKLTVIKWFYDNVIKFRNDCGDGFNKIREALFEVNPASPPYLYSNEANMLNKLTFGEIGIGQRNSASEQQLALLKALQNADAKLIADGLDYYERYERLKSLKENYALMN